MFISHVTIILSSEVEINLRVQWEKYKEVTAILQTKLFDEKLSELRIIYLCPVNS